MMSRGIPLMHNDILTVFQRLNQRLVSQDQTSRDRSSSHWDENREKVGFGSSRYFIVYVIETDDLIATE